MNIFSKYNFLRFSENRLLRKIAKMDENIYLVSDVISSEFISELQSEFGVLIVSESDIFLASVKYAKLIEKSGNPLGISIRKIPFRLPNEHMQEKTGSNVNETSEFYRNRISEFIKIDREKRHSELQSESFEFYIEYSYEKVRNNGRKIPIGFDTIPIQKSENS